MAKIIVIMVTDWF